MFIIEIIALIFLCKRNGDLALQKGLKPKTWKIYTIGAWLVAEFLGCIIGLMIFGQADITHLSQDSLIQISCVALFCAFGGYLFVRYNLEKRPDHLEDDIKSIGVDDLQPPPRQ